MNCKSIKSPIISQQKPRLVLIPILLAMVLSMVSTWSYATNHDQVAIRVSCTDTTDINTCTATPDTSSIVNLARTAVNLGVSCTAITPRVITLDGVSVTYSQQCTLPHNQEKILCDSVKTSGPQTVQCVVPGQTTVSCGFTGSSVTCDMKARSLSQINSQFAAFNPTVPQAKFVEVLTNICTKRNVSPDLQRDCDLLLEGAVNNDPETSKAVEQITPEGASAPVDSSQSSIKAQNNNLATRFGELRRGIRGLSTRGIHLRTSNPINQTALYEKLRGQLYAYAAASADEVLVRPNQEQQSSNQPEAVPLTPETSQTNESVAPTQSTSDQEPKKEAATPSSSAPVPSTNKKSSDALGGRLGTFVNGTIQVGEKDKSDNELGFNFKGADLTGGIDYRFSDLFYLGMAFGYSNNSTEMNAQRGSLDMNGFNLIFYGSYYPAPGFFIDTNLNIGGNDYAQVRRIRYSSNQNVDQSATADYFGSQISLHVGAGYEWAVNAMTFSPYIQMQYARADVNGYRESIRDLNAPGSGWGLRIDDQEFQSLLATLGGEFNYAFSRSWGVIMPQLRLEFVNELNDDVHVVQGQFIGDPDKEKFRLPTDKPDSNYFNVGLGLSAVLPSGHTTYFFYQTILGYTDLTQHVFNIGYRWEF